MSEIVFVEPNKLDSVPFTTSDIVAEHAEVSYRSVQRLIEKHEKELKMFGIMRFEIAVSGKAGRPKNIYHLNEEQTTYLITLLKNTEPVIRFKAELVREFYRMKKELMKRGIYREELKPVRRGLTDAIQDNPDHKEWDYKLYTDLAYKSALGRGAAQIRRERGAKKADIAIEYMMSGEMKAVEKKTHQIAALIELGMDYRAIKRLMLPELRHATAAAGE
jgi:phage regulator Rha-like protein